MSRHIFFDPLYSAVRHPILRVGWRRRRCPYGSGTRRLVNCATGALCPAVLQAVPLLLPERPGVAARVCHSGENGPSLRRLAKSASGTLDVHGKEHVGLGVVQKLLHALAMKPLKPHDGQYNVRVTLERTNVAGIDARCWFVVLRPLERSRRRPPARRGQRGNPPDNAKIKRPNCAERKAQSEWATERVAGCTDAVVV